MDKYEYQVCTEQIKQLISEKRFAEAMEIADTIDWRRVRSVSMLITVSEIYKVNKRYEDAKDILLLAYERHPNGRDIVYALCELFIKLGDVVQAIESYKEFMAVAPDDANSCILLYKIYKAQDVSLEEQIDVLEEYKRRDYREKWAYELASLYHKTGQEAKCVAECDELILWFGEGKYVRKAMELKMQHQALSRDQQAKFDGRAVTGSMPVFEQPVQENSQFGNNAQQTGPMIDKYGEYLQQTGQMGTTGQLGFSTGQLQDPYASQSIQQDPYASQNINIQQNQYAQQNSYNQTQYDAYGNPVQMDPYASQYDMYGNPVQPQVNGYSSTQPQSDVYGSSQQQSNGYGSSQYQQQANSYGNGQQDMYSGSVQITPDSYADSSQGIQVTPGMNHLGMTQDIMVQALGTGIWNTTDMQSQLGSQVREVMMENEQYSSQYNQYGNQSAGQYGNQSADQNAYGTGDMADQDMVEIQQENPEPLVVNEPPKPVISVHTGVIDISESDLMSALPGEVLPEEKPAKPSLYETSDIMSALEGVIPGTTARESEEDTDNKDISITGVSSTVNVHKTKSRITGQIPSFLPSSGNTGPINSEDDSNEDTEPKETVYEIKEETEADEIQRISAISEKAFPGFTVPEINIEKEESDEEAPAEVPEEIPVEASVETSEPVMEMPKRPVFGERKSEIPVAEIPEPDSEIPSRPEMQKRPVFGERKPETPVAEIPEPDPEIPSRPEMPKRPVFGERKIETPVDETSEPAMEMPKRPVFGEKKAEPKPEVSPFEENSDVPQVIQKRITSELPRVPEDEKLTPVGDEAGSYPYDTVTDIGYVEELPEIEQPEDVDDILKTGKIPADEVEKALAYETDAVSEIDELEIDDVDEENDEDDPFASTFMRGDVRARREFDDAEYRIFCRYDGMENLKAQLVDVMDTMSMNPGDGNIVIMGPASVDCKGIAISLVKVMQSKNPYFSGKVAKISGEALNKKNIKGTLEKLENGALVVERAGGLTHESVTLITNTLSESDKPILVIFVGLREEIKPLFKYTKHLKTVFNARMDILEFTDDDLVNYGRGYALENEYSIDDMGGLALHNRISELQTFDHKVTTDEVKEIIDMAMQHVDKKNMGHFMDMLLGRRYDDEDNIILSEKDFIF